MQHQTSSFLPTAEIIHWVALAVMAIVYSARLRWLYQFKLAADRSAPGNPQQSDAQKGARYSLLNITMPWAMESTRTGFAFYLSFVVFHLGVAAGIGLAFLSTVARPILQVRGVGYTVGSVLTAAFFVALYRIGRRLLRPVMRLISTPDDYFSLIMLAVWLGLGVVTQAHIAGCTLFKSEVYLVAYLLLTSFFLLYVPFSKISHYLYYPFTRWWIGKALGRRGSLPYSRG